MKRQSELDWEWSYHNSFCEGGWGEGAYVHANLEDPAWVYDAEVFGFVEQVVHTCISENAKDNM